MADGELFNETLVRQGYSKVASFPPNVKYDDRFLAAEEQAGQSGGLGDLETRFGQDNPRPGAASTTTTCPTTAASEAGASTTASASRSGSCTPF